MTVRTASCSCGQLTVTTRSDPISVSVCHCLACQRRSGSVFAAQARFRRSDAEVRGAATAYVRVGDSGGKATFYFCAVCGVTVYYLADVQSDLIAIPVGTFADPTFPHPVRSVYEERKHPWVELPICKEHIE